MFAVAPDWDKKSADERTKFLLACIQQLSSDADSLKRLVNAQNDEIGALRSEVSELKNRISSP